MNPTSYCRSAFRCGATAPSEEPRGRATTDTRSAATAAPADSRARRGVGNDDTGGPPRCERERTAKGYGRRAPELDSRGAELGRHLGPRNSGQMALGCRLPPRDTLPI